MQKVQVELVLQLSEVLKDRLFPERKHREAEVHLVDLLNVIAVVDTHGVYAFCRLTGVST